MTFKSGRHFLHVPGPTNVPDRILRAIDRPTIDHRGLEFARLAVEVFQELRALFKTSQPVYVFPSSGTGAWEAAMVNTLSPGDRVLLYENGFFAMNWGKVARSMGLNVDVIEGDWRRAADLDSIQARLAEDRSHEIRALMVVHNETSVGACSRIDRVRQILDDLSHPALLMVDAVSSLGATDYRHDEWRVDVTISGSQKGLMLPPGLGFNAVSRKALDASRQARLARSYWDWQGMSKSNETGFFPYTPATNLLFGLREALAIFKEEGLEQVFARHRRLARAAQKAVETWGLEVYCCRAEERSTAVTAVLMPGQKGADELRRIILERFDLSLGMGLGQVKDKIFRIGHLGSMNDLMLAGALSGVEMGLAAAGIPFNTGGVTAALQVMGTELAGPVPKS